MRQVFTSQRLETVEGVARMLEEAGIAVHISNPRSYHSRRSGQFSYAEPLPANKQPAVWVRRPEDQPRARELLRQAGLLSTTRGGQGLPLFADGVPGTEQRPTGSRWGWRLRIALLGVIAAVAMFIWLRRPPPAPVPAPVPAAAPAAPAEDGNAGEDEEAVRVRITPPPAG
ncbi:MAG: hypothetical protein C0P65_002725 [Lysobacteraceae bacterium]|jgi:hypothetical protein|nr:hypothetical protein [Xanthomonadaceae bacterium]